MEKTEKPYTEIECPCGTTVPVTIDAEMEDTPDGGQILALHPDMTDLWAHYFTHQEND